MNRRELLAVGVLLATSRTLGQPSRPATTQAAVPDNVVWHDVRDWGVEGRAFTDTESYFDRLPARAKGVVRPEVWNLAHQTAGMSAHFQTRADAIYVRYEVTNPTLAMAHMPATGVSGVDLYVHEDASWRWLATHRVAQPLVTAALVHNMPPQSRRYHLNLPLYNGVKSLQIGVSPGAKFEPIAPRHDKPILFYGTSITQGGCASRPGMTFLSILGRRLDRPMLNFGFSGNGKMEPEVARFLADIDAALFVIDCSANMNAELIAQRAEPLVKMLREVRTTMPILLLDERRPLMNGMREGHDGKTIALRKAFESLRSAGIEHLYFRGGEDLLGDDDEATVDGSHPTDLGMLRHADALEADLKRLLA